MISASLILFSLNQHLFHVNYQTTLVYRGWTANHNVPSPYGQWRVHCDFGPRTVHKTMLDTKWIQCKDFFFSQLSAGELTRCNLLHIKRAFYFLLKYRLISRHKNLKILITERWAIMQKYKSLWALDILIPRICWQHIHRFFYNKRNNLHVIYFC